MDNLVIIRISDLRQIIREELKLVFAEQESAENEFSTTYLNVEQAAEFIKLSKATLYGLIYRRKIPYIKQGRRVLFEKEQIKKWMRGL